MPFDTEQLNDPFDLRHLIITSATIPTKIIAPQIVPNESNACDKAFVPSLDGKIEDEQRSQFMKTNNVPHQKQCFIIICCSDKMGKTMLEDATALFLAFATTVRTYEIVSSAIAIMFAILNKTNKTLYIIMTNFRPFLI